MHGTNISSFIQSDPTAEPISLTEAKDHLRIDGNEQDVLLQGMLVAARQRCEVETRTVIADCTCQMKLDGFPDAAEPIHFNRGGIKTVTSITYEAMGGPFSNGFSGGFASAVTLSPDAYRVDVAGGRIIPQAPWPVIGRFSAVTVNLMAGSAPACVKQAMLLILGALFENREDISESQTYRIPTSASYLLAPAIFGSYL